MPVSSETQHLSRLRCAHPDLCPTTNHTHLASLSLQVDLGTEAGVVLLDIAFSDSDPKHGFLTGTKQTLLETKDGGKNWEPRFIEAVDEEGINYRYTSVSFSGDEGWLVGKPGAPAVPATLLSRASIS